MHNTPHMITTAIIIIIHTIVIIVILYTHTLCKEEIILLQMDRGVL